MVQAIISFFQQYISNKYVLLFVLSVFPLIEMRGAVILSIGMDINYFLVFLISGFASSVISMPLLFLFNPIMNAIKKNKLFCNFAINFERKIQIKSIAINGNNQKGEKAIYWALLLFIAVPLPLTGVWTGSCMGAFLGLDYWKTILTITLGNFFACGILLLLLLTAKGYVDIILIVFLSFIVFSVILLLWQNTIVSAKQKKQKKTKVG